MKKLVPFLLILIIFIGGCVRIEQPESCDELIAELPALIEDAQNYPSTKVQRIIDGDTIVLENGERVRLIGIDTPERYEDYYEEAAQYLEKLISNETIYLEQDISERDKYGRLLYYIYTKDKFVNAEMVASGYARAYPYEPDTKYYRLFDCLEQEAKEKELNIWSSSP